MMPGKEDENKSCDRNGCSLKEYTKSDSSHSNYNDIFCDVLDDDVICEEIIESVNPNYKDLKSCNTGCNDEVICIDDSEDENYCINGFKTHNSYFERHSFTCKPDTITNSEDAYLDAGNISFCASPAQSPLIDEILCDIGFNLILCKFFSSSESDNPNALCKEPMAHLNVPLKFCKCGFKSEAALVLKSHVNLLDGIPLKCCLCDNFAAKILTKLVEHMKIQHNVPEYSFEKCPMYQCQFCDHNANSLAALKKHTKSCRSQFTLNANLAPRLGNGETQGLLLERFAKTSRRFSVIYPNPKGKLHNEVDSIKDSNYLNQINQHSVIVPNTKKHETFPSIVECGYCKASTKDLQSLGVHMEVVHDIQYSFNSPKKSKQVIGNMSLVTIPDEDVSIEVDKSNIVFSSLGYTSVEKELAKMAIRKECLWCSRKFEYLDEFEEHIVQVHDDLKCDVEGFWLAIETGLVECSGSQIALLKACPWCLMTFEMSSSCHRHLLNCHWNLHLESCKWCSRVIKLESPYSLNVNDDMEIEGVSGGDSTSSSSFLSDIDSKEVLK